MGQYVELVLNAKKRNDSMLKLLERMNPLVKSYGKKMFFLDREDAEQEIILSIIEAVHFIRKCETDGQCLTYINNAAKFKYAELCKKNIKKEIFEEWDDRELGKQTYIEKYNEVDARYDMTTRLCLLSKKQKNICRFLLLGYSDREIANHMKVSRQYVNRVKKEIGNKIGLSISFKHN